MTPQPPISDMRAAYENRLSLRAVGDLYGLSEGTVATRLRAVGVTIRPPRPTSKVPPGRDALMAYLYHHEGMSVRDVAKALKMSRSGVHSRMRAVGVATRPLDPTRPRKKRPLNLDVEVLEKVVKGWTSGTSLRLLVKECGKPEGTIRRAVRLLDIVDDRPPSRSQILREQIVALATPGTMHLAEIRRRVGCSYATVLRAVAAEDERRHAAGLPSMPRRRPRKKPEGELNP